MLSTLQCLRRYGRELRCHPCARPSASRCHGQDCCPSQPLTPLQRCLRFESLFGERRASSASPLLTSGDLEPYSTWQFKRSEFIHQCTFLVITLLMSFTEPFEVLVAPETSLLLTRATPMGLFLNAVQFTAPLALLLLLCGVVSLSGPLGPSAPLSQPPPGTQEPPSVGATGSSGMLDARN